MTNKLNISTASLDVTTTGNEVTQSDVITVSGNTTEQDEEDWAPWPVYKQVLVIIPLALLCFIIVAGNILTITVFIRDRKIRTIQNTYIFNLAVTDLFIGLSSVPFYAIFTVMNFDWVFGSAYCKVWSTIDYWVCCESSLTIILISHDRLLMVTQGAQYTHSQTTTKALVKIAATWIISFLIYAPAVIGYDYWRGYSTVEEGDCDVEFATVFWYTVLTAFLEFCVPFILLLVFSALLYWNLRKRTRKMISASNKFKVAVISSPENGSAVKKKNESASLARDKKAAKSLAILVVTYAICWTPYTILTVIIAFCEECIPTDPYEVFTWLLWANSAFNPFLYAVTNSRFRSNFEAILCKCFPKDRVHPTKSTSIPVSTNQSNC